MWCSSSISSASMASVAAERLWGWVCITSAALSPAQECASLSSARRRSPSVMMPTICPPWAPSQTAAAPTRPAETANTTSLRPASGSTTTRWRSSVMSPNFNVNFLPRLPPGCARAKSSLENPRASISAMARGVSHGQLRGGARRGGQIMGTGLLFHRNIQHHGCGASHHAVPSA